MFILLPLSDAGLPANMEEKISIIEKIYEKEGAPANCKMIVGQGGHRFFGELCWPEFQSFFPAK